MVGKNVLRVIFLLIAASVITAVGQERGKAYDGAWWSTATEDSRLGWLAGYIYCATSKVGNKELGLISWYTLEPEVTKFYSANPNESKRPIPDVVAQIIARPAMRALMNERAKDKGGEPQPHFFDGEYWRQGLPDEREGFIQGYLACYGELKTRTARFSKPYSWYVSEISKWFGVKEDDPAEIDSKRESVEIATVLFKFKDAAPKTSR
jgi:hypothetical protein